MMHGYLPFDRDGNALTAFRTWRNTITGEAAGMFPIDSAALDFDGGMIEQFDALIAEKGHPWRFRDVFPRVLTAGQDAGRLTEAGALLLDPTGTLRPGIPLAPPEGDAGTGSHGPLQQLHQRHQRLGGPLRRVRRGGGGQCGQK